MNNITLFILGRHYYFGSTTQKLIATPQITLIPGAA